MAQVYRTHLTPTTSESYQNKLSTFPLTLGSLLGCPHPGIGILFWRPPPKLLLCYQLQFYKGHHQKCFHTCHKKVTAEDLIRKSGYVRTDWEKVKEIGAAMDIPQTTEELLAQLTR